MKSWGWDLTIVGGHQKRLVSHLKSMIFTGITVHRPHSGPDELHEVERSLECSCYSYVIRLLSPVGFI